MGEGIDCYDDMCARYPQLMIYMMYMDTELCFFSRVKWFQDSVTIT